MNENDKNSNNDLIIEYEVKSIFESLKSNLDKNQLLNEFKKNKKLVVSELSGSLSNFVIKVNNYIIKYCHGNEHEFNKIKIENNYYIHIKKDCFLSENGLMIKYESGRLINNVEINSKKNLEKIFILTKEINKLKFDFEIPKLNIINKYLKNKDNLILKMKDLNLNPALFEEAISFYDSIDLRIIHSDLNEGNILIDNSEIKLIDFGNLSITQWIFEHVVLIVNWDLEIENINYILSKFTDGINFSKIFPALILYAVDILIWNENKNSEANINKANRLMKRINSLIYFYDN